MRRQVACLAATEVDVEQVVDPSIGEPPLPVAVEAILGDDRASRVAAAPLLLVESRGYGREPAQERHGDNQTGAAG